jgi:uncharacterized protein DUF3500
LGEVAADGLADGVDPVRRVEITELTAEQKDLVRAAISDWVADAAPGLAEPLVDVYESQLDETVIGWSTSVDRESAAYMRVDGPRVLIEFLNRDNPGEAGFIASDGPVSRRA